MRRQKLLHNWDNLPKSKSIDANQAKNEILQESEACHQVAERMARRALEVKALIQKYIATWPQYINTNAPWPLKQKKIHLSNTDTYTGGWNSDWRAWCRSGEGWHFFLQTQNVVNLTRLLFWKSSLERRGLTWWEMSKKLWTQGLLKFVVKFGKKNVHKKCTNYVV